MYSKNHQHPGTVKFKNIKKISTEKAYTKALANAYKLMQKGKNNLSEKDTASIATISKSIQDYEKIHYPFPMPKTISEIVELKMFKKKLNRVALAEILGIGTPKLSQILNNKREPDMAFLKAPHEKLGAMETSFWKEFKGFILFKRLVMLFALERITNTNKSMPQLLLFKKTKF